MSLLDEVDALESEPRRCVVARWEQTLTEAGQQELTEAVTSDRKLSMIYEVLCRRDKSISFAIDSFRRHYRIARGDEARCSCHL